MERLLSERFLIKRSCAIGAAVLVGAIGIGLALLNRIAGDDGELDRPTDPPEPIEGATKPQAPAPSASATTTGAGSSLSVDGSMTKAELYEVASDLGIKGRSSMNKAELIEAIRAAS